jgi:glycosyltransferase involved in cell wall biosynthesis
LKKRQQAGGIPSRKIFVWPDGVDLSAFRQSDSRQRARLDIGMSKDSFVATYCGHFYPEKGVENILRCAAILPEVQFLLVGGWERDIARFKKRTRDLDNVSLAGFVPNQHVRKYLAASNVLLMTYSNKYRTASWVSPLKLFEYMAARRPIISTDLPILRKHLDHNRNAILVPPDDAVKLAKGIETLRQNPGLASRLADTAYSDVQPYTWHNRARGILTYFSASDL